MRVIFWLESVPGIQMNKRTLLLGTGVFAFTWVVSLLDTPLKTVWPVIVALVLVVITRRAFLGLLIGAFAGSLILCGGDPWQAYLELFARHLAPSLQSSWKVGAILFTLILGGFSAVLNEGAGFRAILHFFVGKGGNASRRFQTAAAGLGIICFFDGLANSMLVGRVCKDMAEKCGVSRVKLAYIVDSTSSAVACLAFVSTWIAYQLSMIKEGYRLAGRDINPYLMFLKSIPFNFYCWFTLVLLFVSIIRRFNPGSMKTFENDVRPPNATILEKPEESGEDSAGVYAVFIPLIALILMFFLGFYVLGSPEPKWPITVAKITSAFGSNAGPLVLVLSGLIASCMAVFLFPARKESHLLQGVLAFKDGVRSLLGPVLILVAAWMIGSVLDGLETAEYLSSLVSRTRTAILIPSLIFVTGSLISFSTGTSWGTMGILFPLAIPMAATACQTGDPAWQDTYLLISVAAVFSGAVFGDHCSPFSDTTIISSISCGVEPHDHIRTQIPFALLTAAIAVLFGFLPASLGVSPLYLLIMGALVIIFLPTVLRRF
jgi:tetracycline resistance efflux pump